MWIHVGASTGTAGQWRTWLPTLACSVALLTAARACGGQGASRRDTDRLIQGIESARARIRSVKCVITTFGRNSGAQARAENGTIVPPMSEYRKTIVASKGRKWYSEDVTDTRGPVSYRNLSDGNQAYMVFAPRDPGSRQPTLWQPMGGRSGGPKEWMYEVLGRDLPTLLKEHRYRAVAPSSAASRFGPLITVTFSPSDLGDPHMKPATADIAPERGFTVVGVRTDGKVVQETAELTRRDGIWLPSRLIRRFYLYSRPFRDEIVTFGYLGLNDIPDSLFAIEMRPGDAYQDGQARYRIGPSGERIFQWSLQPTADRRMATGWAFIASLAVVVLLGLRGLTLRRRSSTAPETGRGEHHVPVDRGRST